MPLGELAALGTAFCWAVTTLFFAAAAQRIGSLRLNLLRLPLALVLLSVLLVVTATGLRGVDRTSFAYLAASAVVGLVIGDLAYFAALRRLGPRPASLLMALAPIFAALTGAALLAEHPGPRAAAGIAVTLGGVAWVIAERRGGETGERPSFAGVLAGLAGAACQGIGLVLAKLGMLAGAAPLAATWVRMAVATGSIWLALILAGRLAGSDLVGAGRRAWPLVLGGAFFGPTLGVWLSLVSARLTDVGVAATIMATSPVLIIPAVMLLEGYRPSARAILGTLIAIAGVALLFSR